MILDDDFPERVVRATRQLMDHFAPPPARNVNQRLLELDEVAGILRAFRKSVMATGKTTAPGKTGDAYQRVLRYLDLADRELPRIRGYLRNLNNTTAPTPTTWEDAARSARTVVTWLGRAHDIIAISLPGRNGAVLLDRCKTTLGLCTSQAGWFDLAARHARREFNDQIANMVSRLRNERASHVRTAIQ